MIALNRVVELPGVFRIGRGMVEDVAPALRASGFEAGNLLVLAGRRFSRDIALEIVRGLPSSINARLIEIQTASEAAVRDVADIYRRGNYDLLLSVGGGSVVDVGKRVHRLHSAPNLVFPTIISNDGLISPISVLVDEHGHRVSLPAATPVGVLVDLDTVRQSPRRYLVAGAGDVLSNLSASRDWLRLSKALGPAMPFNDLAYELAMGAAENLVCARNPDFDDDIFLTNVIRAQIYSGLAMSLAGTSRPCSGAEHLISHAIDHLGVAPDLLHGAQVGSISLFVLSLLDKDDGRTMTFAQRIGLQLDWRSLSSGVARNLRAILESARVMRPDRRTILDDYSDEQILAQSAAFGRRLRAA